MTAAVGAALRIAVEQDVAVSAEQLRAVLRDTAKCLRAIQQDAAWRTVATSSGQIAAFTAGWVQAVELLEQSAEDGVAPTAAVARSGALAGGITLHELGAVALGAGGQTAVEAGRCYLWSALADDPDPIHVEVRAVADDGAWADIVCTQRRGGQWEKRQPLGSVVLVPTELDVDAFLAGGQ